MLSRKKKAKDLSFDHKPDRVDERARVESAGGWIDTQEASPFILCFCLIGLQVLNIPKLYALGLENAELLENEQEELIGWVNVHKVREVCLILKLAEFSRCAERWA